ncbi:MAG TPA: hypothetical protein VF092_31530 [Longimicrobium sp.]
MSDTDTVITLTLPSVPGADVPAPLAGVELFADAANGGSPALRLEDGTLLNVTDAVRFTPSGEEDDWQRLNDLMAANADARAIVFAPGAYTCSTPGVVPSGTALVLNPGVRIVSTLSFTGQQTQNVFFAGVTLDETSTTLAADTVVGSTQVTITIPEEPEEPVDPVDPVDPGNPENPGEPEPPPPAPLIEAGSEILIIDDTHLRGQIYTVLSADAGTLQLDRAVLEAWSAATALVYRVISRPRDIRIYGNGAVVTGTGDRAFEFGAATDCVVSGLRIDASAGTFGDMAGAFDIGGYRNTIIDCHAEGLNAPNSTGFALESQEAGRFIGCSVSGFTTGFSMLDCWNSSGVNLAATRCTTGVAAGGDGPTSGCIDCSFERVHASACAYGCVDHGYRDSWTDVRCVGSTSIGFNVNVYASGTRLHGYVGISNVYDVYARSDVNIDGLTTVNARQSLFADVPAGSSVVLRNFSIGAKSSAATNQVLITGGLGSRHYIADGSFHLPVAGSVAIVIQSNSAVYVCERLVGTGSGTGTYGFFPNGSGVLRTRQIEFSAFANPLPGAPAILNRGTITLNGTTEVPFYFPDLNATDSIRLTRKSAGSTAGGLAPTYVATTNGAAVLTGTVDLTTRTYPDDFDDKTFTFIVDGVAKPVTFRDPADVVEMLDQLNIALDPLASADLDSGNRLVITTSSTGRASTLRVSQGTLAASVLGLTNGKFVSGNKVTVKSDLPGINDVYVIEIG